MKQQFTAIIEPAEEGGYWAYCAEVPAASGQGETIEEVIEDLGVAIELVLEDLRAGAEKHASASSTRATVVVG